MLERMFLRWQLELDPVMKGPWLLLSPIPWVAAPVEPEFGALGDSHTDTPAAAPAAWWDHLCLFWGALGCGDGCRLGVLGVRW